MKPTRRERIREATIEEIKSIAWRQIEEQGAAALSLRAIAREMGMTAPGLYRYYPSRDDLVTALISEAFDSFSQYLEAALDAVPITDHAERFRKVCEAYFHWAVAAPARYSLIFGTPAPGYRMGEAAYPSAQRAFLVLQTVLGEAVAAGEARGAAALAPLPPELRARYQELQKFGMPYAPIATHLALTAWGALHGFTSLCLHGYLENFLADQVEGFLQKQIEQLAGLFGFE